jgi:hypothetical protein
MAFCTRCSGPWCESHRISCAIPPASRAERTWALAGIVWVLAKDAVFSVNGPAFGPGMSLLVEDQLERLRNLVGAEYVEAATRNAAGHRPVPLYRDVVDGILRSACISAGLDVPNTWTGIPDLRNGILRGGLDALVRRIYASEKRCSEPVEDVPDRMPAYVTSK